MSLLAGSISNVPPPTSSPRPVATVPVLESMKRCHPDRHLEQVARQLDEEMVIEEGPLLLEGMVSGEDRGPHKGTVSGEDKGPDPDTVSEDGPEDDEHAVGEEGEHHAPVEEEDGTPEKPPPEASDKSVADSLANTAHRLCPMLCPLAGKRAQTVRSLITWIAFIMW